MGTQHYLDNPLIHADRRAKLRQSEWTERFRCDHLKPLIICRGPIRKEAMDVFTEMGINHYGILLSEKDSIVYRGALAPELRVLTDPDRVHRVPDYSGATKEEREQRIADSIAIAHTWGYNAIFAGYAFMAEDEQMVAAMEAMHTGAGEDSKDAKTAAAAHKRAQHRPEVAQKPMNSGRQSKSLPT